jgi:two-component system, LuxR family, response regulator FixJ
MQIQEKDGTRMVTQPTVYVVDDDPQVRESLTLLMHSMGLNVEAYGSAEEFLEHYDDNPGAPRCLVLDVRMPGLSGLGLQEKLNKDGKTVPVIMITGYGNVPMAVQAMSAGATDFIEKPFSRQTLMMRVQEAMDRDARQRTEQTHKAEIACRVATLSQREREVMDLLVSGNNSKHIASKLEISEKTVAKHRAKVFQKMRVDSVAALVTLVLR